MNESKFGWNPESCPSQEEMWKRMCELNSRVNFLFRNSKKKVWKK